MSYPIEEEGEEEFVSQFSRHSKHFSWFTFHSHHIHTLVVVGSQIYHQTFTHILTWHCGFGVLLMDTAAVWFAAGFAGSLKSQFQPHLVHSRNFAIAFELPVSNEGTFYSIGKSNRCARRSPAI